jgi:hypothetical protein
MITRAKFCLCLFQTSRNGLFNGPIARMASQKKALEMINPGGAKVALRDFQRLSIRATRIKRQSPISNPRSLAR